MKDDFCLALPCLKSSIRSSISPLVASSPLSSATSLFTDMTAINLALLPEMFTRMNYIQKLYTNTSLRILQFDWIQIHKKTAKRIQNLLIE